jgi:hypothetical protein
LCSGPVYVKRREDKKIQVPAEGAEGPGWGCARPLAILGRFAGGGPPRSALKSGDSASPARVRVAADLASWRVFASYARILKQVLFNLSFIKIFKCCGTGFFHRHRDYFLSITYVFHLLRPAPDACLCSSAWVPESVFAIKRFVFRLSKLAPVLSKFFLKQNTLCILIVLVLGSGINHMIFRLDPKFCVRKPVPVLLAAVEREVLLVNRYRIQAWAARNRYRYPFPCKNGLYVIKCAGTGLND